jgi:hypothetical protein
MPDAAFVQPLLNLLRRGLADIERQMMHTANIRGGPRRIGLAILIAEDRDQAAVTGIEIEMALRSVVEIWLIEDEGHSEDAFPEVDGGLTIRADQRDVMQPLCLELSHSGPSFRSADDQPSFASGQAPPPRWPQFEDNTAIVHKMT